MPPLNIKFQLESNPLKSRILVGRLAVKRFGSQDSATRDFSRARTQNAETTCRKLGEWLRASLISIPVSVFVLATPQSRTPPSVIYTLCIIYKVEVFRRPSHPQIFNDTHTHTHTHAQWMNCVAALALRARQFLLRARACGGTPGAPLLEPRAPVKCLM